MSEIRAGLIGCGGMGRAHSRAVAEVEGARMVGFSDVFEEKAKAYCEEYGGEYAGVALKWSARANELTDYGSWPILDTLARASFETGDVERAIHLQEEAIKLSGGNIPELDAILARYREANTGDDQAPAD